jgi:hypothetical protein
MRSVMNRWSDRSMIMRVMRVGWFSIVSTVMLLPETTGGPSG